MTPFEVMDCALLVRMSGLPLAMNLRELRDRIAICGENVLYHHFCETTLRPMFDDPDYRAFMRDSSSEVAGMFAALIHRLRPGAGFFTYIDEHTDGIMSESNTAIRRELPLWPYSASDNVNRALNSEPDKMSFNLCMSFVDYQWRFVTVPQGEIRLRLHQNLAHGAPPALVVLGTMDQEDRQSLIAGKTIEVYKRIVDEARQSEWAYKT